MILKEQIACALAPGDGLVVGGRLQALQTVVVVATLAVVRVELDEHLLTFRGHRRGNGFLSDFRFGRQAVDERSVACTFQHLGVLKEFR